MSRDHVEKGRFACPVGSYNGFKGVRKDLKADMIHSHMTAESDGEVFCFDDGVLSHTDLEEKSLVIGLR